jgi:hypothetical protein
VFYLIPKVGYLRPGTGVISLGFFGFAIKFFLENLLLGFFFAIAFFRDFVCVLYFLPHGLGILFFCSGVAAFAQV